MIAIVLIVAQIFQVCFAASVPVAAEQAQLGSYNCPPNQPNCQRKYLLLKIKGFAIKKIISF